MGALGGIDRSSRKPPAETGVRYGEACWIALDENHTVAYNVYRSDDPGQTG